MSAETLARRTIVVTGGARGIGRGMAEALAEAGAKVVITARSAGAAERAASEIGANCVGAAFDLSSGRGGVERAVDEIWSRAGRIDTVINNAGAVAMKPALETTETEWDDLIRTNLSGLFWSCQSFAKRMLAAGGGKIVNVASDIGIRGEVNWAAYSASKGGVVALSKSLAWEWAPKVSVNIIAPGPFMTDANRPAFDDPDILAAVSARVPLGRVGDPRTHLGPLAVMLAGEGSDFMTGAVFRVDGGICRS